MFLKLRVLLVQVIPLHSRSVKGSRPWWSKPMWVSLELRSAHAEEKEESAPGPPWDYSFILLQISDRAVSHNFHRLMIKDLTLQSHTIRIRATLPTLIHFYYTHGNSGGTETLLFLTLDGSPDLPSASSLLVQFPGEFCLSSPNKTPG